MHLSSPALFSHACVSIFAWQAESYLRLPIVAASQDLTPDVPPEAPPPELVFINIL
jgi:hypothetical protein